MIHAGKRLFFFAALLQEDIIAIWLFLHQPYMSCTMKYSFLMGFVPANDFSGWLAGLVYNIKVFHYL